jgi:hypothetical protein
VAHRLQLQLPVYAALLPGRCMVVVWAAFVERVLLPAAVV